MIHLHHKEQKPGLRKDFLARRQALSEPEREEYAVKLRDHWLQHFHDIGKTIAGYSATKGEMDIAPLLSYLSGEAVATALPCVNENDKILSFRRWKPGDAVTKGAYGISEAAQNAAILTPDIIIVPLLAFDRAGHRLGYGAGYYDRTLEHLRKSGKVLAIGAAFSLQEHPSLPSDPHDERLDFVVTEKEVIEIKR